MQKWCPPMAPLPENIPTGPIPSDWRFKVSVWISDIKCGCFSDSCFCAGSWREWVRAWAFEDISHFATALWALCVYVCLVSFQNQVFWGLVSDAGLKSWGASCGVHTLHSSGRSSRFVSFLSIVGTAPGVGFIVRLCLSLYHMPQCA